MCVARREAMTEYRDDIEEMEEDDDRTFGEWLQDNLRIIISVIIVLLLALGIYSYSKRSQDAQVAMTGDETVATADMTADDAEMAEEDENGILAQISNAVKNTADKAADKAEEAAEKTAEVAKDAAGSIVADDDAEAATAEATSDTKTEMPTRTVTMATEDKEVSDAFVMAARAGDGKTHLARRALAGYLSKNSVDGLTGAHKVYIEDYLQKAVGGSTGVVVGEEVRFSKDLIKQAIEHAQGLTEAQTANLQKYAAAASLS